MKTVGQLIKELSKYPENSVCHLQIMPSSFIQGDLNLVQEGQMHLIQVSRSGSSYELMGVVEEILGFVNVDEEEPYVLGGKHRCKAYKHYKQGQLRSSNILFEEEGGWKWLTEISEQGEKGTPPTFVVEEADKGPYLKGFALFRYIPYFGSRFDTTYETLEEAEAARNERYDKYGWFIVECV